MNFGRINRFLSLFLLMVTCLSSSTYAFCHASAQASEEVYDSCMEGDELIYINAEDLVISASGIFLMTGGGYSIPVRSVHLDANGLFVKMWIGNRCPACKMPLNIWGLCVNPRCALSSY